MGALVLVACMMSGCINIPAASGLPPAPRDVLPEWVDASKLSTTPYLLQVGDVLDIKILSNPELNDQVVVRPDGMISTTIASDVPALGHSTRDVQDELALYSEDLLRAPKISVIVRSFAPNRVYVLGEVRTPGEFITIGPNLTLLQAIARAGGLSNSAQPDNIVIVRRGATDKPQAYAADYRAAASGENPSADVRLAPYDVVFVPRSGAADTYLYFQQYLQQFVPDSVNVQGMHNF
ncbi:MAG: polysaccharide biosynthesis/export family protein [Alphaproteobacteria bacterium]|nr:polysaccharide biosynthesis/export family protein [Alphaproteobacteria bacterium]